MKKMFILFVFAFFLAACASTWQGGTRPSSECYSYQTTTDSRGQETTRCRTPYYSSENKTCRKWKTTTNARGNKITTCTAWSFSGN